MTGETVPEPRPIGRTVPGIWWRGSLFELGLAVAGVGLGWIFGVSAIATLHWSWHGMAWGILATVPPLGALVVLQRLQWEPVRRLVELARQLVGSMFLECRPWQLAILAAAAGLGEEILFRGALQAGVAQIIGMPGAVILSGIVFGLVHLISPAYAVAATVMGWYLGWLFAVTGSLTPPFVVHALYDFVALQALVRGLRREQCGPEPTG